MLKSKLFRILSEIYTEKRFIRSEKVPKKKKLIDFCILFLALVSILLFILEELNENKINLIHTSSMIIDYIFLIDYTLRVIFSGFSFDNKFYWRFKISKNNYIFRWYGLIDIITVLPPLIYHVLHFGSIIEEYSRAARILRILRAARILRILRSLKFFRYSDTFSKNLLRVYRKINKEFKVTLFLILFSLLIGSFGLLWYAKTENESGQVFNSFWDAMYWSLLNIMGQGEGGVHGLEAKLVTLFLMLVGIAFFGIITGTISSFFMERMKMSTSGIDKSHATNHILICGWNSKLSELLTFLQNNRETHKIVLLYDRGNPTEPFVEEKKYRNEINGQYIDIEWIRGNSTDESDLERACAISANKIIILADTSKGSSNENDIDARSLMTLIKLRELYEPTEKTADRKILDITIELMSKASVKFAKVHGAKRVIYSDELVSKYITSEFKNDLPLEILIESQKLSIINMNDIIRNSKYALLTDIEKTIIKENQSVFLGLLFKPDFLNKLSNEKSNRLVELLKESKINYEYKREDKKRIEFKDNLIIFNPWNRFNEEIISFLLKEYDINNFKDDVVQCIIISNQ